MFDYKNYYTIFDISKMADDVEIKSAFGKLAIKYHSDHNKNSMESKEIFKYIYHIYEVLSDKNTRNEYDEYLNRLTENDLIMTIGDYNLNLIDVIIEVEKYSIYKINTINQLISGSDILNSRCVFFEKLTHYMNF